MLVLSGADLVLPDRVQSAGTLVIEDGRIVDIGPASAFAAAPLRRDRHIAPGDLHGHLILPGFIDVHVHGLEGVDTLDGNDAIRDIARRLPKYGVTAFCPTTVACSPATLRLVLDDVGRLRSDATHSGARVLPAHLESNFINAEYKGAQPEACLCMPPTMGQVGATDAGYGHYILDEIDRGGEAVGIVTLAPELDGALDLVRHLVRQGRRVSLGHSGATAAQARGAIDAGATHATHLFNRMSPLHHREPGLAGAVLTSAEVAAEVICDGVHVHPDMVRMAIAAKGVGRMMAITDGVAAAGLPNGAAASLGGRPIRVEKGAAYLEDGTLAGSVATMDAVFRFLVRKVGLPLNHAAQLCATTPASELGLADLGMIAKGASADLLVLDRDLRVKQTYLAGNLVWSAV